MATKNSKRGLASAKLVYIEWVDAVADIGWEEGSKADIHAVRTVGFVVSETADAICIASTVSHDNSNARMHIPKAWIKKRKVINLENKLRKTERATTPAVDSQTVTEALPTVDRP